MKNNLVIRIYFVFSLIKIGCESKIPLLKRHNKNVFSNRPGKKVFVGILALICMLSTGCKKSINANDITYRDGFHLNDSILSFEKFSARFNTCIVVYGQLVALIRSNPAPVQAVVLDDGTQITTGHEIITMTYKAIKASESNSLFRSQFSVVYNLYGYEQENITNCWSLGCIYENAGQPPFTNIIKQNLVMRINTRFIWNVPGRLGMGVKYLILK